MRHDGGDAETGFGLDLGGGLALGDPEPQTVFVDVDARPDYASDECRGQPSFPDGGFSRDPTRCVHLPVTLIESHSWSDNG